MVSCLNVYINGINNKRTLFSQCLQGGLRHASASIGGSEAYKHMKFEGGVHRVQRVPKTEKQGRIHTSTMTVAILPQPTEVRHRGASLEAWAQHRAFPQGNPHLIELSISSSYLLFITYFGLI